MLAHVCMYVRSDTIHTYVCMYTYVCTHIHTHIRMHMHIQYIHNERERGKGEREWEYVCMYVCMYAIHVYAACERGTKRAHGNLGIRRAMYKNKMLGTTPASA